MSLATRCTACGTVFRVVQDQLKVSEGWVRCGRCDEVFNALEGLFDLEREPPPPGPLTAASTAQKPGAGPSPGSTRAGVGSDDPDWPMTTPADDWQQHPPLDPIGADLMSTRPGDPGSAGGLAHEHPAPARDESVEFSNARWDAELLTDVAAQETRIVQHELDPLDADDDEDDDDATRIMPQHAPEFLRHAERQERWQRPQVRLLMGLAVLVLLAALGLQVAHHFRDTVAVRWPQARPLLQEWCAAWKCTLEAPRRIEDIYVESTTLARAGAASDAYRLSVNLRNRSALPLSVPSVDLKLTDGSGALIARRMLSARDFGSSLAALPPGSDTTLQMLMSTGSLAITGYTVEVFYP